MVVVTGLGLVKSRSRRRRGCPGRVVFSVRSFISARPEPRSWNNCQGGRGVSWRVTVLQGAGSGSPHCRPSLPSPAPRQPRIRSPMATRSSPISLGSCPAPDRPGHEPARAPPAPGRRLPLSLRWTSLRWMMIRLPSPGHQRGAEEIVQRSATAAAPGFRLSGADLRAGSPICCLVDWVPCVSGVGGGPRQGPGPARAASSLRASSRHPHHHDDIRACVRQAFGAFATIEVELTRVLSDVAQLVSCPVAGALFERGLHSSMPSEAVILQLTCSEVVDALAWHHRRQAGPSGSCPGGRFLVTGTVRAVAHWKERLEEALASRHRARQPPRHLLTVSAPAAPPRLDGAHSVTAVWRFERRGRRSPRGRFGGPVESGSTRLLAAELVERSTPLCGSPPGGVAGGPGTRALMVAAGGGCSAGLEPPGAASVAQLSRLIRRRASWPHALCAARASSRRRRSGRRTEGHGAGSAAI